MITLKLKVKDQDIELTMDEAKVLYDELNSIFNKPITPWIMPLARGINEQPPLGIQKSHSEYKGTSYSIS